jgi:methyl-accepting chemotaxis protein
MKLATQLLAAPLLTAAVALASGALTAFLNQREARASEAQSAAGVDSLKTIGATQQQLAQVHAGVYRTQAVVASLDEAAIKAFRSGLNEQLKGAQRVVGGLAAEAGGDAELGAAVAATTALIEKYRVQADKAIELTEVEANMGVAAMKAGEVTYTELAQSMQQVVARRDALHAEYVAAAASRSTRNTLLLAALGLAATFAALAYAWAAQRRIVRDLKQAVDLGAEVAAGNLSRRVETERKDEIGDLLRSLGHMVVQLGGSMNTVRQASDSIRTAAQEIASGNTDLSQRTEQAASSLQQTASSMEQLSGTVRQTADSARTANDLVATARGVAQRGGSVVAQVVSTMDEINSSSKKIADIIGTIDGIAFQTNILALNAAVEAARAGEQGRGFAVVAGEVRNLAQRSAEAAREIKGLIGTSVEKVDSGSRYVREAGSTMDEIVASVQRVSDIIAEISAAAAEQSGGLGQVNGAVGDLDRATQQNAALVEQSAAAAESLREQASRLGDVVSRFQIGAHAAA